ncbi:hypothetical protein [Auraticoccus monumenti]|uniref:Uncharacterized protein n=1 Tax=Auraticoccus monumenti TaxID=675864 RepID=A0A1G6UNZ8_9ACTN|nr:hypothetical protein [Auraticoccus monumenti]SDD43150.1 hypothetical protein SAMN04489747_0934 [Auraticoccus monumenti]
MTRPLNDPLPETCGDVRGQAAGALRHRRAGEKACAPCAEAIRQYRREWRRNRQPAESRERYLQLARARNRAFKRLADAHKAEFQRLLLHEQRRELEKAATR